MTFLIADMSSYQGASPNIDALVAHPQMFGVILKATEGTYYAPQWFVDNWPRARAAGGKRYGDTWFRGAYHYLDCRNGTIASGRAQAEFFLAHVKRAGGWGRGDMLVFVDAERGGVNANISRDDFVACVTGFSQRIHEAGLRVALYARGFTRDFAIESKLGCDAVWNAGISLPMPLRGLEAWKLDDVVLWQYTDGTDALVANALGYPLRIEGFAGALDISVFIDGNRKPTIDSLRARLVGSKLATLIAAGLLVLAALFTSHVLLH